MTDTIAQLVARVEAASGPDRELMLEAFNVANPASMCWDFDEGEAHSRKLHRFAALLDAGAWLDAAMTLVPEGWRLHFLQDTADIDPPFARWAVSLWWHGEPTSGPLVAESFAATPALALVAACLRAHDGGSNAV